MGGDSKQPCSVGFPILGSAGISALLFSPQPFHRRTTRSPPSYGLRSMRSMQKKTR